jgi:alpha-L-arabinofuranosidase
MDDGAVIVKVVNTTGAAAETQVRLAGLNNAERGEVTVLAGGPWDENTIEQPERVKPETRALDGVGGEFTHTFPAHSLTVLRVE